MNQLSDLLQRYNTKPQMPTGAPIMDAIQRGNQGEGGMWNEGTGMINPTQPMPNYPGRQMDPPRMQEPGDYRDYLRQHERIQPGYVEPEQRPIYPGRGDYPTRMPSTDNPGFTPMPGRFPGRGFEPRFPGREEQGQFDQDFNTFVEQLRRRKLGY
jgi:hypothetical protein